MRKDGGEEMNANHYDGELIKYLFLEGGLSSTEIATVFTGNREAVYYWIKKLNIYINKKCVDCGTNIKTRRQHQVRCHKCRYDSVSKYHQVCYIRHDFAKVKHRNPELAIFLHKWMREEEGIDFTNMALDGILESNNYIPKKMILNF